jgi:drug/metabolite transporter (DMT)-like permease
MLTKSNLVLISTTLLEIFILSLMNTETPAWVIMGLYAILGLGLRYMIQTQGLVSGNAVYDILGIIGSALIAVFYFKEPIKVTGVAGIIIALIAMYLLNL